jgi:glycosyltransferase involved in cell wall biosynthesis
MPAYNASKYIAEAIDSILNQTLPDFELLICDDGSTDSTLDIIKSYAAKDKRITFFENTKNIGNLKTTNFLFEKCEGKYIAIQDADDISTVNRLELLAAEFEKDSAIGIVGTNYFITDENLNIISCSCLPLTDAAIKQAMKKEVPPLLYASILVKKELVDRVGLFRPNFDRKGYADLDWIFRICEITKVENIKEIGYYYRQNGINKYTRKKNFIEQNGLQLIFEAHLQRLRGEKDFIDTIDYLAIRKFLGQWYKKQAENAVWVGNTKEALKLFRNSLAMFPFDIYVIKNIGKLMKQYINNR